MADAPGSGSSIGTLEIVLIAILAIGFLMQLQTGGINGRVAQEPVPQSKQEDSLCGLTITQPTNNQKIRGAATLVGEAYGCQWVPTETVAINAVVVDSTGRALSAYTSVPPVRTTQQSAVFSTSIVLIQPPTTTKGFLILSPAQQQSAQGYDYRIPVTFYR